MLDYGFSKIFAQLIQLFWSEDRVKTVFHPFRHHTDCKTSEEPARMVQNHGAYNDLSHTQQENGDSFPPRHFFLLDNTPQLEKMTINFGLIYILFILLLVAIGPFLYLVN